MNQGMRRFIDKAGHFEARIVDSTTIGRDAYRRLQPSPLAIHLLTQAMTGALLLASDLKEGIVFLKTTGNGPAQHLTVEATSFGEVRGFIGNPNLEFDPEGGQYFQRAIGEGELIYKRRSGQKGNLFTSVVKLIEGELALNFSNLLLQSDQIQSGMVLGVKLDPEQGIAGSGGVLVKALPGADSGTLLILEKRLSTLPSLGVTMSQEGRLDALQDQLFEGMDVDCLRIDPVQYRCHCSKKRIARILCTLAEKDLQDMIDSNETQSVHCQFCSAQYAFDTQDLIEIKRDRSEQ